MPLSTCLHPCLLAPHVTHLSCDVSLMHRWCVRQALPRPRIQGQLVLQCPLVSPPPWLVFPFSTRLLSLSPLSILVWVPFTVRFKPNETNRRKEDEPVSLLERTTKPNRKLTSNTPLSNPPRFNVTSKINSTVPLPIFFDVTTSIKPLFASPCLSSFGVNRCFGTKLIGWVGPSRHRRRFSTVASRMDAMSADETHLDSLVVVVLGASGDLARKKTFPALCALHKHGYVHVDGGERTWKEHV